MGAKILKKRLSQPCVSTGWLLALIMQLSDFSDSSAATVSPARLRSRHRD
jgi:hypothetical protein